MNISTGHCIQSCALSEYRLKCTGLSEKYTSHKENRDGRGGNKQTLHRRTQGHRPKAIKSRISDKRNKFSFPHATQFLLGPRYTDWSDFGSFLFRCSRRTNILEYRSSHGAGLQANSCKCSATQATSPRLSSKVGHKRKENKVTTCLFWMSAQASECEISKMEFPCRIATHTEDTKWEKTGITIPLHNGFDVEKMSKLHLYTISYE